MLTDEVFIIFKLFLENSHYWFQLRL